MQNKRKYLPWTKAEIEMIRNGILPPNHNSNAACYQKAKSLGFEFHVAKRTSPKNWDKNDVDTMMKGHIPTGKSWKACIAVAEGMGIDFKKIFENSPWSDDEITLLRQGIIPPHRDQKTAFQIARKHGWDLNALKIKPKNDEIISRGEALYKEMMSANLTVAALAAKHNMTRQNAHRLIKAFKVDYFDKHFDNN